MDVDDVPHVADRSGVACDPHPIRNSEVIEHGMNGFLVPPDDPDQLARHLLLLLDDSDLRTKLGHAANVTYSQRFRPEVMTRQLEDCFGVVATK